MGKQQQGVSVEQAAARLGMSKWGVYKAVGRGELKQLSGTGSARVSAVEVDRFRRARQAAAAERLAAKGADLVQLAESTRVFLQPYPGGPKRTLSMLGADVVAVFGAAALHAASMPAPTCGWCASVVAAQLLRTDPPPYGEVMLALLGEPCARDMERFAGAEIAALAARVHPGGVRPAGVRTAPVTAAATSAVPASRPRPAEPFQDDNGRALVARRLREVRARAKQAKRAGDQKYALRLAQMARDLEQDAARVDGRALSAASRPGRLRCGHLLAAGCACPRRAMARGQR